MRILVYPHDLRMGGSQLNAIELGAAVKQLGHEVILFGQPGPLAERGMGLGLEFIAAPAPGKRPSPSVISALVRTVRERRIDIVHGYEWPPALECLAAARIVRGTTAAATVMSMAVAPFIPTSMPLMVGTEQIRHAESSSGRSNVHLLEPPVDLPMNSPDADLDLVAFRNRWGLDQHHFTVVCVSRLAKELKLEGILSAIDAVNQLAADIPVRLVITGTGPAEGIVNAHAARVNEARGERTIIPTGELADPRPAYAVADVVLGMGGSALRGLSFGKPLVVQGERGFWELLTPDSLPLFLWQGWYGSGPGSAGPGAAGLVSVLGKLVEDKTLRTELGVFGRSVVEGRFSLTGAALLQTELYQHFMSDTAAQRPHLLAEASAAGRYGSYVVRRRYLRLRGQQPSEDFNARPVAVQAAASGLITAKEA
ncbi:glycosyltransferase [Paenarthrobacter sp. JL.01a]|uniref:glycosyltransferase n=1 Tax=Paenarthrobacter sp. JL.01a TaxID=2979324 RepID=UPI0021CA7C15|nr:glycosyltransferase [Paenarthrobacter sp. JL.01a]UXM89860.1 glycosyltransferase [Paenarthrobacter sp. JL.01a]